MYEVFKLAEFSEYEKNLLVQLAAMPFHFTSYRERDAHAGILYMLQVNGDHELYEFPEALFKLQKYGWVQRQHYAFRMHPLLKELVLKNLRRKYNSTRYYESLMVLLNITPLINPYDRVFYSIYASSLLNAGTLSYKEQAQLSNKLSALLIFVHDSESALPYQQESLRLIRKIHKETPISAQVSMRYANLFLIYKGLGETKKAFNALKKDLHYKEEAQVKDMNYSMSLASLGNMNDDLGKYEDAVAAHEKSINIRLEVLKQNPDDPTTNLRVAQAFNNIALPLLKMGRVRDAYDYQYKAIKIRERFLAGEEHRNHHSFSESYGNFAEILLAKNDTEGAIKYLKKAIGIYLSDPHDDPLLSTPLVCLADIQLKYNKIDQAYLLTKEAVRLCKKCLTEKNFMLASAFFHFSRALLGKGKVRQALYYAEEAIAIKISLNKKHPGLVEYRAHETAIKKQLR